MHILDMYSPHWVANKRSTFFPLNFIHSRIAILNLSSSWFLFCTRSLSSSLEGITWDGGFSINIVRTNWFRLPGKIEFRALRAHDFSCPELFQLGLALLLFTRKITTLMLRYASKLSLCKSSLLDGRTNQDWKEKTRTRCHTWIFLSAKRPPIFQFSKAGVFLLTPLPQVINSAFFDDSSFGEKKS